MPSDGKNFEVPARDSEIDRSALIAWLAMQDPGEYYEFCDMSECLLTQYLRAGGIEPRILDWRIHPEPGTWLFFVAAGPDEYGPSRWTFGDALARARAL